MLGIEPVTFFFFHFKYLSILESWVNSHSIKSLTKCFQEALSVCSLVLCPREVLKHKAILVPDLPDNRLRLEKNLQKSAFSDFIN